MHPEMRVWRGSLGLSLAEVARQTGVSARLLAAAENGTCGLDARQRQRVCDARGASLIERSVFVCPGCR